MRNSYCAKLLLKSIVFLVITIFVLTIIYDTSSKAGESTENENLFPSVTFRKSVQLLAPSNTTVPDDKATQANHDNDIDDGVYLTSDDVELFGEKSEGFNKTVRYNQRFWDLAIPTGKVGNDANFMKGKTASLMNSDLDNLWRPSKGQPDANDSDRIVPQLVWQMEAANSSFSKRLKPKKILIWDTFKWWSKVSWAQGFQRELLQSDCHNTPGSVGQCIFTEDQSISAYDAVITARDSFHTEDIRVPRNVLKFTFILESPFHSEAKMARSKDLMATYWRGSDIVTPYSKWVYYDLNKKLVPNGRDYTIGKTKPVAIFVSNCAAWNNRMEYVTELQKSIQVDVYGHCGSLKCSRSEENNCFEMLKKDYFFYLSFENSNCRDYITEKLFTNGLGNDVISVVMGAHPDDYAAMAPYKSYIHVEEFDNPAELGQYLNFLISNPSDYNKYFEWKGTGEFISTELFCRICAMVHYADFVPPPKRTKRFDWGHRPAISQRMCLKKGNWYWTKKMPKSLNKRNHRRDIY